MPPPAPAPPPAQDIAPREASVLFHMGKIYKKLDMLVRSRGLGLILGQEQGLGS